MTTIREEIEVNAPADAVWRAVRDVGEAHRRLFPGILTDARRRFVYASVGGRATHHNASIEVVAVGAARSRLIWITDVLPDELRGRIAGLMQLGAATAKATLERDLTGRG
jgi:carbon monoxide dehydrogenase subunit G